MELMAILGGRTERVSVEPLPSGYGVRIGEREFVVDWRSLGAFARSFRVGGRHYLASVFGAGPQRWRVGFDGTSLEVEVVPPLVHLARLSKGAAGSAGRQTIRAYMPGRVVKVEVAIGDRVTAGQAIVVLEAMKMQNELQAEAPGRVVAVHVEAGAAVEGGDPLVELE